jgi:hypothetical protein
MVFSIPSFALDKLSADGNSCDNNIGPCKMFNFMSTHFPPFILAGAMLKTAQANYNLSTVVPNTVVVPVVLETPDGVIKPAVKYNKKTKRKTKRIIKVS